MSSARTGSIGLVFLFLSGCGAAPAGDPSTGGESTAATPPSVSTSSSTGKGIVSSGELDLIVPPDPDGNLPPDLVVACPSGLSFPIGALEEIVPLEQGDPAMAVAIALFLAGEEGQYWPQEGWLILHQSDREVLLVHEGTQGPVFMTTSRENGAWRWSGAQGGAPCPLQYTTPGDVNTVDWRLDPNAPSPGPDDDRVEVILTERDCVGGIAIGDRLLGPQVVMTKTSVHVAFAAVPPPGDAFDCQGNPETPYSVALPQQLGDRTLVEGLSTGLRLEDYLD